MRTADVSVAAVLSAIFGTPFVGLVAPLEDSGADFERFTYAKLPRAVLYALSAVGAFLGTQAFVALFGGGTGLPRFEAIGGDVLGNLAWTPLFFAGDGLSALNGWQEGAQASADHAVRALRRHLRHTR